MAATTTKAKKPSKIRRSIVGPLRGRSARICDRPALRWQAAVIRRGDLRGGAPPGCVQDSLTQRREGGKRETHTKTQRGRCLACGVSLSPQATLSNALRAILRSAPVAHHPLCVFV